MVKIISLLPRFGSTDCVRGYLIIIMKPKELLSFEADDDESSHAEKCALSCCLVCLRRQCV